MSRTGTVSSGGSNGLASSSTVLPSPSLALQLSQLRQPTNSVSGVYLLPSPSSPRAFHGVLFLHRGPYAGAIFPFHLELPREALGGAAPTQRGASAAAAAATTTTTSKSVSRPPKLTFTQPIPHPLVHPHTRQLRLTRHFPSWDPHVHTLPQLLSRVKSLFKSASLRSVTSNEASNSEIWTLLHSNEALFNKLVEQAVKHSVSRSALYGARKGAAAGAADSVKDEDEDDDDDERREGFGFRELKDDEYQRLKREILGS